jgi:hypothetical protein
MNSQLLKAASFAILMSVGAIAASDQNLLPNGNFNVSGQVAGWTPENGSIAWSSDDVSNDVSSGSLLLSTSLTGISHSASAFSSCFAISPGAGYAIGGASRITVGGGSASIACSTYSDASCSMSRTNLSAAMFPVESTWGSSPGATGTLPVDARSARCALLLNGSGATQSSAIEFDNLFFNSAAPAVPVRLQEFTVD